MNTRLFKIISALVCLSLLFAACAPGPGAELARSDRKRDLQPSPPQAGLGRLVDGNNSFAWDLYGSLRDKPGNLIFSPFSISLALAMTYAGAHGDTQTQMQQTLHFDLDQAELHPAFNALDLQLEQPEKPADQEQQPLQLRIANAVWAEKTYSFLPDFLDTLAANYGAGIQLADFINNSGGVRDEVNRWVEDQTQNKIKDLIPAGGFNSDTRMALVNAIYFKADWLNEFSAESTQDAPFNLLDGSKVVVPTMNQHLMVPYAAGDGWQAVELPYAGETASMLIIVPDAGRFDELEASLDNESVSGMLASLEASDLLLSMPKFKYESSFGLSDRLSALGMSDGFDPSLADFSGMTGKRDMFISAVVHKAFVAVDEKGTEAAAATAVIMAGSAAPMSPLTLNIDRPFVFLIRDTHSGQILFIGRVLQP